MGQIPAIRAEGVEIKTQIIDETDKVLRHIITINNDQFFRFSRNNQNQRGLTTFEIVKRRTPTYNGYSHWLRLAKEPTNQTEYHHHFNGIAKRLTSLGHSEDVIAYVLNVSDLMIEFWKKQYPAFQQAIIQGRAAHSEQVSMNLINQVRPNDKSGMGKYGSKPNEMR